jgi:hypothetical protein
MQRYCLDREKTTNFLFVMSWIDGLKNSLADMPMPIFKLAGFAYVVLQRLKLGNYLLCISVCLCLDGFQKLLLVRFKYSCIGVKDFADNS